VDARASRPARRALSAQREPLIPYSLLIDTETLAAHLGEPGWRTFDCRHDLARPDWGEAEYARAHIPGASFAHLERDLSAPRDGRNGRHPLPAPNAFVAWLGRQGLEPGDQVVAYDAAGGAMAARLWWMLRWAGHRAAAVLDGGLATWSAEKRPLDAKVPRHAPTDYSARQDDAMRVDAVYVAARLGKPGVTLLDARASARYRGESEPIDPVAGHIPGALNRFNGENLGPNGRFKSPPALRAEFEALLGARASREVVHYCGSGVAACHNLLAMEIAGLASSRVYPGSWSEWIADPRRPQAKGAE